MFLDFEMMFLISQNAQKNTGTRMYTVDSYAFPDADWRHISTAMNVAILPEVD